MDSYVLTINLRGVVAGLHQALQRAIDLVAFGLHAAGGATDPGPTVHGSMKIPGVIANLTPARDAAMSFDTARDEFKRWVLACGLRDAVEGVSQTLEEARKVGVVVSFGGEMTGADWNERVVGESARFDRRPLPDKINFLAALCGPSVMPAALEKVKTINKARNCLVHRQGIVGNRDCNASDGLLVEWTKLDLVVPTAGGDEVVTALPFTLKAGERLSMRNSLRQKLFRLGDTVSFTAQEFSYICWTLFQFGQQLVLNLQELMNAKGLTITASSDQSEA